jgi:hypothetical protein
MLLNKQNNYINIYLHVKPFGKYFGNILFLPKQQCPVENQQLNRRGLPASAHTPACQSYGFSIALFMVHTHY